MFRVPVDTVLRRAAVTSLLVLTTTFAACGGDGDSGANSAASNEGQSPLTADAPDVALAPTSTEPAPTTAPASTPTRLPYKKFSKELADQITLKVDDAATIKAASSKKIGVKLGQQQVRKTIALLKDEKFEVTGTTGGSNGLIATLKTTSPSSQILFYDSAKNAARSSRNWQHLISLNPGAGRADRIGRRVYTRGLKQEKWTKTDLKTFEKFKDMVEQEI